MPRGRKKKELYQVNIEYKDEVQIVRLDATSEKDAELKALFEINAKYQWPCDTNKVTYNTQKITP